MKKIFINIFNFYYEGFKSMTVGKKLWLIIFIKLFIMFFILKLFFFPNFLKTNFSTDKERSDYILKELTNTQK
ncbi:MAG: DUF4492 domain-containing protein [Bacteroidia bacterium]|nr:MAG: DUF4492 domain-containing protein [Bacteroidia bacterium]